MKRETRRILWFTETTLSSTKFPQAKTGYGLRRYIIGTQGPVFARGATLKNYEDPHHSINVDIYALGRCPVEEIQMDDGDV